LKIDPDAAADRFEAHFDGRAVQDPSIVVVRLENGAHLGRRRLLGSDQP
jgi:hypothetical protein